MKMTPTPSLVLFHRNASRLSALAVALAATGAFADLYWACNSDDASFSSVANWSDDRNGAGGVGRPGLDTGITYFCKMRNGSTLFDEAAVVADNVSVGTQSSSTFVWSAADPSYGVTSSTNEFQVGTYIASYSRTPTHLRIDSGTYRFSNARIGYDTNGTADLLLKGGAITCTNYTYIGAKNNTIGTLTIDGGAYTSKFVRVGVSPSATATLEVKSGTVRTTSTGGESLVLGYATNTTATVVVDGGTLDNTGYIAMGFYKDTETLINIKSGDWTASGIRMGAKANKATNYVDNAVSRIVIDGGNVAWTNASNMSISHVIGEGSHAELVVNAGTVNCNANYFYVGDTGPATFTMNGGTFTMVYTSSGGYLTLGHMKTGSDVGKLILNGGELAVRKLRLDYAQPGSKVVFNGGTLKPIKAATDFIDANANFTCEVQSGGMVIDTAGYNVTINHDIVLADGVTSAPLIKKGAGTLTLSGSTPFSEADIFVYAGAVKVGGVTYAPNVGTIIDASAGGDLGVVVIHDEPLESWLKDSNFASNYSTTYGAAGTNSLEQPLTIIMSVNGALKRYTNLETGKTYSDTLNGVSYSFTTEDVPPRTIQAVAPNGALIKNIRDVGSWPLVSVDGTAKMNQGVIFRGATLDDFANATAAQKAASALACLKSEIDLRTIGVDSVNAAYQGATKSWAAVDADYIYCPINYNNGGSQVDSDDNGNFTNQVRRMFSRLGTPGALPAYFHCAIGTDRTGITGLLLLGLMGVEEKTLYRDYLMSNFANIGSSRSPSVPDTFIRYMLRGDCNSNKYVYRNKDAEYGVSVAARARAYLEMCGVTTAEIANITQALSGETPAEVLSRVNAYEAANNVRTVSYIPYSGATSTNATHRLPAGTHILPMTAPTRTGYVFAGWDTEHESNGIVYALWEPLAPYYWASANGATQSFTRAESWDPVPEGDFVPSDVLVLNKGNDKTALLSDGSITVDTFYVGWGSLDGGRTSSTSNDRGGRLDMTGGSLTVTNILYIGGYRSAYSNIVNVSGGCLVASTLRMGDYYDSKSNGKCDILTISGSGVVSNVTGEAQMAIRSGGSSTRVDISGNGAFVSRKPVKLGTAAAGKAVVALDDNGVMELSAQNVIVGNTAGSTGTLTLDGSSAVRGAYDVSIAYAASSTGRVEVAGNASFAASHYVYIGRLGEGELTISGGVAEVTSSVEFGYSGASGNAAVLNLDGGKLIARKLVVAGSPNAVFNWNGGTLESSTYSYADGNIIPADSKLAVNVLEGGAVYNAVVFANEEIQHTMSGVGSLTKTGDKALTVSGAADLDGGYVVEEGALTLTNVTDTEFKKISVASGATLDLNGAEVTVDEYVLGGVRQRSGTYSAHNGVIHVKQASATTMVVFY